MFEQLLPNKNKIATVPDVLFMSEFRPEFGHLNRPSVQEGVRQPLNLKKEVCIMTVTLLRKWRDVEIKSMQGRNCRRVRTWPEPRTVYTLLGDQGEGVIMQIWRECTEEKAWRPPPQGKLKINTDAAYLHDTSKVRCLGLYHQRPWGWRGASWSWQIGVFWLFTKKKVYIFWSSNGVGCCSKICVISFMNSLSVRQFWLRLVCEKKFRVSHGMCRNDVGRSFRILIKKLQNLSGNGETNLMLSNLSLAHVGYCST
jgi:hypothetical protein